MADQLSINIQVTGAQSALAALQQIRQAQQAAAQAAAQTGQAQQQSAAAAARAAQQHQQNANVIAQAWNASAQRIAQSDRAMAQSARLSAEERRSIALQSAQAQERAAVQAAQAVERAALRGASAQQRAALQGAQATQRAAVQTEQALQRASLAAEQGNRVYVSLGGTLGNLPGPLGSAANAFGAFTVSMSQTHAAALGLATVFTGLGTGIIAGLASSVDYARGFERNMADVQIVTRATTEDMARMTEKAIELGIRTQFSSQEAAKGLYELGSAGLTVNQSIAALDSTAKVAMLSNRDFGAVAKDNVAIFRPQVVGLGRRDREPARAYRLDEHGF
jgi:hypothetical protein